MPIQAGGIGEGRARGYGRPEEADGGGGSEIPKDWTPPRRPKPGRAHPVPRLPFDLVPDFIPVAGYLDDAVIVALLLRQSCVGRVPS
jgi:hypothetical protein